MRENPFKSKSQARLFFAKEARGELAPGTAKRWMEETPDFASLPEYVGENPDEDEPLVIELVYVEGPHSWDLGQLVEARTFWDANSQLNLWGNEGRAAFAVYILGELVYEGVYDLAMTPADLRRQMVLYLDQLGTEDAERLLELFIQPGVPTRWNPELKHGYIDPDTGAWMSRRRFEKGYYEHGDAVVSETITEDQPTVDAINEALLAGTVGIGTSGLVTEARPPRRPWPGRRQPAAPEPPEEREQERGLSEERIREISEGHGLADGGYEWENVRDDWREQLQRGGRHNILEIEAETFGTEVMGSASDFEGINLHSLDSPVILFDLGVHNRIWPERLIGTDETYRLVKTGTLNEYEREDDVFGDEDGMITHEGGSWALYDVVEEDEEEEEEDERRPPTERERIVGVTATQQLTDTFGPSKWAPWWPAGVEEGVVVDLEPGRRKGWQISSVDWIFRQRGQGDDEIFAMVYADPDGGIEPTVVFEGDVDEVLTYVTAATGITREPEAAPAEVLGAYGQLPTVVVTELFGRPRPLPWNPAVNGWFLGGSRFIQYRRQEADGAAIYAVVDWTGGAEFATLFTGRVDEVILWLQQNLAEEIGAPRTVGHGLRMREEIARGVRRISSNDPSGMTYIVDGEVDEDGYAQWVPDAVAFLSEKDARSDMTYFPYRDMDERIPYRAAQELFRLHGPWRIEERAAIFKHCKADSGFMLKFRLFGLVEAAQGQRVQLFDRDAVVTGEGNIRDIVIVTWLAVYQAAGAIVGFRLVNGDNGIEFMNGQVDVPPTDWNKGYSTIRKIMDLLGVRAVFVDNGWPEEYYLNVGYADDPFVYF